MYKTSEKFKNAVYGDSRTFLAKVSDGTHSASEEILSLKQTSRSVADDCISVGGAVSSYVEIKMWDPGFTLDGTELEISIGMMIDSKAEWVPLGLFTAQKPKSDNGVVTFTAYDRIQTRMSGAFLSELTYPCDGKAVLAEMAKKTGVPITTANLPDGVMIPKRAISTESTTDESGNPITNTEYVTPFDGYTYREALSYIAQFYGMFATMDRAGSVVFRWYAAADCSISAGRYYDDLTLGESVFNMEKIICQAGNDTFSAGEGTACMQLENPVMTQERLAAVYQQIKALEFLPASVSFLGDPRIDVGDIITVVDKTGKVVKIPVMSLVQDYDGGLLSEVQSFGKSESVTAQCKGPTAQKLDRAYTDLFLVKEMVGGKASFDYVYSIEGNFKKLSGDYLSFKSGEFEDLKAKQADFETATAKNFTATSARIDAVTGDLASYKNVVAENFSAANGKIENLESTTLKAADAKLTYATIESLNALKGDVADLNVGNLTARVATIEGAYISKTETKQLLAGYADIKLANVAAGTIGSALIGDGAITDAKIASVSANKLTAGTIDASKINVTNLNADNLTVGTINGQRIGDKSIDLSKLSKEVPTKAYLDSVQNGLQNQIDNAIQTYTTDTIPTLKNSPASSWTDNSTRAKHVGDICYVTNAGGNADGYCYRFTNTGTSTAPVYEWVLIKDSDVNKALQELVTVNGDISGLKSFQSETSSWRTSTDTEISSVKTRTTTIETTYSTKEETKSAADSAKSSAIASAKGYTDTAKTDAIASSKSYTDTATKDMATSTAVANAKKEAIDTAAKDASSKASTAQSTAISAAAKDATSKADAAKSSAISAAATDATTKANTAKSEAISTAASDATKKANDAKSAAISAASSDATSKANTAKSEAISAAASDATTKANAALNSAKGYADDAVAGVEVGGRNLLVNSKWCFTATKDSEQYATRNNIVTGYDLDSLIGKKLILSMFVDRPGDSQASDGGGQVTSDRWGMNGVVVWRDSTGKKSDTVEYPLIIFNRSSVSKKRVYNTWEVSPPQGYDKMAALFFTVQMTIKPAANNNSTWSLGYPKLEVGTKPTDWTPAPEDIEEAINTKVSTNVFNEVKQTVDSNSAIITKLTESVSKKADGSTVESLANTVNTVKQTTDANTASISTLTTTVNKKADSSTVDTISKTLNTVKQTADSNSANISELSKTVSTKADGSTVETLTNRVSTAEQNLDGFKTTVSKTYVTSQTYNEKVTNLESGISAAQGTANTAKSTADAATTTANTAKSTADTASKTASAAKSTAEGAISTANSAKSTADAAKSSVDSLEIGGRNLFRKTDTPHSNNDYLTAQYNYASEPLVAGETYTVTICVTPAENVEYFTLHFSMGNAPQADLFVTGTKKQIISKTFIAHYNPNIEPSVNPLYGTARFYRFPNDGTVTGNSTIHWVKIEKGNKATDWTPAPEDAIDHQYTQYYRSTSTTTPTGGTWQDTVPDLLENTCIWTRQAIVHVGGDVEYSDPVMDSVTKKVVSMSAEVTKTAEGLTSTANKVTTLTNDLTDVSTRLETAESKITQNAESIALTVKKDGVISAINQTSESVKISANKISLTAAGLVEIINSGDTKIKAANLNLSATDVVNIINSGTTTIKASKLDLSASDVVNIINKGTTKIEASKLNLSGYVTVSDLSGSGTTTIDGSNIKTGKISTDRLDVTGIFAKDVSATKLHVTGNSKIDGNLVTSGINASNITTGTISADRLDVAGIFAKDVTATGTITGANLVGGRFSCTGKRGTVELAEDRLYAKYDYTLTNGQKFSDHVTLNSSFMQFSRVKYSGNTASEETTLYMSQEELTLKDVASFYKSGITFEPAVTINKDLRVYGTATIDKGLTVKNAGLELYAAKPFIDFHFSDSGADYTSRIIELESGKLNINGTVLTNGGKIWGTELSVNGDIGVTGTLTASGTIKTTHSGVISATGRSTNWLNGAQPNGAVLDVINTTENILMPGMRLRTKKGAWVTASYDMNNCFYIYYAKASRLGGTDNGTDAAYAFSADGNFSTKTITQTSDEREKNILSGITEKYEDLFMRLKPVLFNWKNGPDGVHMGFGAQTTLELAERCGIGANELAAVHKSETEEPWSMSYTEIVPLTVQMTQKALLAVNSTREEMRKAITSIDSTRKEVSALGQNMTARMESLQYQLAQAFDRIAALEKENKSLRQALS